MLFRRRRLTSSSSSSSPQLSTNSAGWQAGLTPAAPIKQSLWSRKRRRIIAIGTPLAIVLVAVTYLFFTTGHGKFSLRSLAASTIKSALGDTTPIQGQGQGRTNILVYGMTLDGLRTDSIILVSYYWQQKKLVTLNIPRDLYVYDGYENAKMGEVYSYAKSREPKNSTYPDTYVASVISKEYNIPINYWVQFNMQGEIDFVNAIGGININVPVAFTDYEYPTWNYSGYVRPAPSFSAGEQHMNGATALIYSRSRHSLDNNQGTDFARSERQAQVIQAVGSRLKSLGIVGNISQISHYLDILGSNITTSMTTDDMVSFAQTLQNLSPQTDYIHGNWATGNGFLCDSSTPAGAYVTLYGAEGNCVLGAGGIGGGGYQNSSYRKLAIYYVQHLFTSAQETPAAFVTAATAALEPTPSPAASP